MKQLRFMPALRASLLAVSLAVSGLAAPMASAETGAVPVKVDWKKETGKVTDFMYGLNAFQAFNPEVSGNPVYNKNLNYMNPGVLRFHSWELMGDSKTTRNGWIDTANRKWDADKIKASIQGLSPDHPEIMINIPGWPSWMDTNNDGYLDQDQIQAFAEFCADLVRIVNVDGGFKVKYWEPTNERDDPYYVHFRNAGQADRLDELIGIYNECAKAMKAVDPTIHTGGLAFARGDLYDQVERFVAGTVNEGTLDFLAYHFYASGDLGQSDKEIYDRVNPADPSVNSLAKHTKDIRAILDAASPEHHIPLWMDEYNVSWSWTNNDPRMSNFKGAVFDALTMVYAQRNGADVTAAWNDYDGVYGKMTGDDYAFRPSAHTFQLLNNYFTGDVVEVSSADEMKVVAYAVTDRKADVHSLMAINRTDDVQLIQPSLAGMKKSRGAIQQHQLSEAGYGIASAEWEKVDSHIVAIPPHSVTVWTDSTTVPSQLPPPLVTAQKPPAGTENPAPGEESNLSGRVTDTSSVNLTSEGTLDWAAWGTDTANPTAAVRKAGGGQQISDVQLIGDPKVYGYTPQWWGTHKATWTDGDPVAAAQDTSGALVAEGTGKGFTFTVPADTTEKQLKVYLGVMGAKGVLTAHLSDGSAPDFVTSYNDSDPNVINNSSGARAKAVVLNFKANSPGQTLTVSYVMNYNHWGNALWLQGATLSSPKSAMMRGSVAPSSSADLTKEGNLDWAVWGTDAANPQAAVSKADVPKQISGLTLLGKPEYVKAYTGDWWGTHSASWSDGTPVPAASNSTAAIVTGGPQGSGFKLSVPADTTAKTLKLYLGVMGTKGVLKAHLSDNSAPDFVTSNNDSDPTVINNSGGPASKVVTITYQAASEGQTLDIEFTLNYNHWGNTLWLQSASLSGADILPPAAPGDVALLSPPSSTSAAITWSEAADNVKVTGYEVYKDGVYVGSTTAPTRTYYLHGLVPNQSSTVTVKARDAAGNRSEASAPLAITATDDAQRPTTVTLSAGEGENGSLLLSWTTSFDDSAVKAYKVYDGNTLLGTVDAAQRSFIIPGEGEKYKFTVVSVDSKDLPSETSNTVEWTKNGKVKTK
ncbi:fibronectin type III domain-containing protein [Paenibacillus gansuensis]|uniref:Fibronectin type III domain-containing protein n=1 Tax=Paenibacillus gansuensis TaxID=306542 RepID=A0ABW5PK64_9BACL